MFVMDFRVTSMTHSLSLIIFVVLTISNYSASSSENEPPPGNVTCESTDISVECSGIQTNLWEVEEVLNMEHFSRKETVILNIVDLKFDPLFTFESTSIRNLTLGYGLEILSSDFFSGSPSLVSLNLQNNKIQIIDDQLFSSLSALKELFLDGNDLQELTSDMFSNLTNLNYLSITRNSFLGVNPDVFRNLSSLEILILSHNNISSFDHLRIRSESLTVLEITDCSIQGSLEKDTFSDIPNLEHLDMSNNKLSEVKPHSLSSLKNLKFLNLSYNFIHRLDDNAFSEMRNLASLDLRGNGISVIKLTSFANLYNVKYLDLSENKLTGVLCEYTTDFHSLETIYLQGNKIKLFTTGVFFYSPHLAILNITGNILECSCPLTDTALYLIENSTMKREDVNSILCLTPSTHSYVSITEYEALKCASLEPCKKMDDEDYDFYDYSDLTSDFPYTDNDVATISTTPETITSNTETTKPSIMNTTSITFIAPVTTISSNENVIRSTERISSTSITSTTPESATMSAINRTEVVFPCKNYLHQNKNITDEAVRICNLSHRENSSEDDQIGVLLPSNKHSDSPFINIYWIIFICLFLLLGTVALVINFKYLQKRKNEPNEYPFLRNGEKMNQYTQTIETNVESSV